MAALLTSQLLELSQALEKAAAPQAPTGIDSTNAPAGTVTDLPRAMDILKQMLLIEKVTAEELKVSRAGLLMTRLGKSPHAEMATLSKQLIARWKAQVLPPAQTNAADQAKVAAAAAAAKAAEAKAAEARKASEAAAAAKAAKASGDDGDESDDSDEPRKNKKEAKKRKKEAEKEKKEAKKSKQESSPSPSPSPVPQKAQAKTSAPVGNQSLAQQFPELTKGPCGLFQTEDPLRDKMQQLFWQCIGEAPPAVAEEEAKQIAALDLSQYKSCKASPSPPPIADIAISSPITADAGAAPAAAAAESTPVVAIVPATSSPTLSPSPPPALTVRSRVELAHAIEAAMFVKGGGNSNSVAYKQKYRDLAPRQNTQTQHTTQHSDRQ